MERTFFFQIEPTLGGNIFVSDFFSTSAASRPIFFPITGIRLLISGKALYRSDRLSRLLREFSYDRFKIYLIVPIVWIELNSIQAIEVVSDVWAVWDRPGSVPIYSFRSSERYSRRLGRSGRSGRSYAWKPGFSKLFAVASSFHGPLVKIARSFQKRIGFDLWIFIKAWEEKSLPNLT